MPWHYNNPVFLFKKEHIILFYPLTAMFNGVDTLTSTKQVSLDITQFFLSLEGYKKRNAACHATEKFLSWRLSRVWKFVALLLTVIKSWHWRLLSKLLITENFTISTSTHSFSTICGMSVLKTITYYCTRGTLIETSNLSFSPFPQMCQSCGFRKLINTY